MLTPGDSERPVFAVLNERGCSSGELSFRISALSQCYRCRNIQNSLAASFLGHLTYACKFTIVSNHTHSKIHHSIKSRCQLTTCQIMDGRNKLSGPPPIICPYSIRCDSQRRESKYGEVYVSWRLLNDELYCYPRIII